MYIQFVVSRVCSNLFRRQEDTGGGGGITSSTDSVLKIDVIEAALVHHVANSLHDIELANQVARRHNLTIEDKVMSCVCRIFDLSSTFSQR